MISNPCSLPHLLIKSDRWYFVYINLNSSTRFISILQLLTLLHYQRKETLRTSTDARPAQRHLPILMPSMLTRMNWDILNWNKHLGDPDISVGRKGVTSTLKLLKHCRYISEKSMRNDSSSPFLTAIATNSAAASVALLSKQETNYSFTRSIIWFGLPPSVCFVAEHSAL